MATMRWAHRRRGRTISGQVVSAEIGQPAAAAVYDSSERTVTPAAGNTGQYLRQLDGLRALAVLAVIVFHARTTWFPGGFIGVDIFFVLSGFLITRILLREMGTTGHVSFRNFYIRRALRLFPALAVACAVIACLNWLMVTLPDRSATLIGTVGALTYSSTWLMAFGVVDLGAMVPTWSLAVEEHFYIIWPCMAFLLLRSRRRLIWLTLLTMGAVAYSCLVPLVFGWAEARTYYAPDTRAVQLLIGCLLAVVLGQFHFRIRSVWALCAAVALAAFAIVPQYFPVAFYHRGGSVLVAVLAAIVVAHAASCGESWISRALATSPMVWVGQRSYGIYLWNLPIISLMAFMGSGTIAVGIKLMLCFLVPALSYRFIEMPFLRLKPRFTGARSLATTARAVA